MSELLRGASDKCKLSGCQLAAKDAEIERLTAHLAVAEEALMAFMNIRTSKGDRPGRWSHILLEGAWGRGNAALAEIRKQ
jgi:hypothetical protein